MKRVLLDCDGILSNFIGGVCDLLREIGIDRTPDDVTEFDFARSLKLTPNEKAWVTDQISFRAEWWSSLAVHAGAQEGLTALREVADVYIVTSPWNTCPTWHHERERWLRRHFDFSAKNLIVTSAKHVCAGDVFVDDRTETLRKWMDHHVGTGRSAIQWITPHNRLDGWPGNATRDWATLVEACRC